MRQTKLDEMRAAAREVGLCLDDYGPGDGVTRYRFFEIRTNRCKCFDERVRTPAGCDPITEINHHLFHWHNPEPGKTERDYKAYTAGSCTEKGCSCQHFDPILDDNQDYFSGDGIYTALGRKEAITFLRGRGARIS